MTFPSTQLFYDVLNGLVVILAVAGAVLSAISIWVYAEERQRKLAIGLLLLLHSSAQCIFSTSLLLANGIFYLLFRSAELTQESNRKSIIFCCYRPNTILYFLKSWFGKFEVYMFLIICSNFAKLMTYSTIALISIQQCIAVLAPLKVKTWCSMSKTRWILLFFITFSLVQAAGRWLLVLKIVKYNGEFPFIEPLFYVFVVLVAYFVLIFSLKRAREQRKKLEFHETSSSTNNTTIWIFFIVTSFTLTNMPFWLSTNFLKKLFDLEPQTINDILTVFSMFMLMDPILTFLSHVIFSKSYKDSLKCSRNSCCSLKT